MATSRIETIIDMAADSTVELPTLLRQVKVVAARIGSTELAAWATAELNGYGPGDDIPSYRGPTITPVRGLWAGFGGNRINGFVESSGLLTDDFWREQFSVTMTQPVGELQSLATDPGSSPSIPWPPMVIALYNHAVSAGEGGLAYRNYSLFGADKALPQTWLRGLLDVIRTKVLDLALALEAAPGNAGEPGGATVEEPAVRDAVQQTIVNIYGDGAHVSTGDGATHTTVHEGDVAGLVRAVIELGLTDQDALAFATAIAADGSVEGPRTRSFLDKVKSGGIQLASGVAIEAAASGLVALGAAFLGG